MSLRYTERKNISKKSKKDIYSLVTVNIFIYTNIKYFSNKEMYIFSKVYKSLFYRKAIVCNI